MTDPERIARRSGGLAAQLLRAGVDEQPSEASVQQTLAALGVSAAVVSTSGAASAVVGSAKATGALGAGASAGAGTGAVALSGAAGGGAVKAVSATLLIKWVGIGVVSGVGLAGAAAVATGPAAPSSAPRAVVAPPAPRPTSAEVLVSPPREPLPTNSGARAPDVAASALPAAVPHVSGSEPAAAAPEVGSPLAAEVSYVDRARALLVSGRVEAGLALLRGYEREFPEARLLPEVLFLELETCDRLGRAGEARAAAQRLLDGFPKSPHSSRARKLLFP